MYVQTLSEITVHKDTGLAEFFRLTCIPDGFNFVHRSD